MILENIKIKKVFVEPLAIFRIFLALVFLTAGIFRIFNPELARLEFLKLFLSPLLAWPVIVFEIGAGFGLLFNKFTKYIYFLLLCFLVFILIWALVLSGPEIINSSGELFAFDLNPTDLFLHFIFLLLVFVLMIKKK